MNECAAVNPDGTIETDRDTINRLVKNRNEIVEHLQSQKAITEILVKALQDQKMRMKDGYKNGYESETIFWTRCIWEIDQTLEREIKT